MPLAIVALRAGAIVLRATPCGGDWAARATTKVVLIAAAIKLTLICATQSAPGPGESGSEVVLDRELNHTSILGLRDAAERRGADLVARLAELHLVQHV